MKKHMMRAAGALLLALAIAITQVPASFVQAIGASGDFEREGNTIFSYNGTATAVSIPAGTTRIASEAFSNQESITSMTFPASLEVIENGAFRSCSSLTDVTLPSGLTTLESGAFAKCENLRSFTFSKALYDLGAGVFSGDDRLSTINLNKNPNFIMNDGGLYNKDMTKLYCVLSGRKGSTFTIPDSVKEVERYAFWGCDNLETVNLSSNMVEIPEFAFSNCENLTEINVPLSVRKISAKAFEDCTSLQNVRIPPSVISIHDTAFDGCMNLNIISDEGTAAYEFFRRFDKSQSALMEYEDGQGVTEIGNLYPVNGGVSSNTTSKKKKEGKDDDSAKLPDRFDASRPADLSKANVWEDYSQDNAAMGQTRVVGNNAVLLPGVFDNAITNIDGPDLSAVSANSADYDNTNPSKLPLDMYPDPVNIISPSLQGMVHRKAFYQNDELSHLGFKDGVTKIGDLAFARSSVKSVILPEGLKSIGYGAFYHCDSLKDVYIPDSVTDISPEAFSNTPFLNDWLSKNGDDFLIVGDGVLIAYRGLDPVVTVPEEVKKIAGGAFAGKMTLQSVNLGANTTEVGEGAFSGCAGLTNISGGNKVIKIADRAFEGCPIERLHIPSSVTSIGLRAFKDAVSSSVVFDSAAAIPGLSYEQTSTRLSNDKYRTPALGNIQTAAVSQNVSALSGTVLDENYLGFRGLTVAITGSSDKTAVLLRCSLLPDETGVVRVPNAVTIDGEPYTLTGASPSAFSFYSGEEGGNESGQNTGEEAEGSGDTGEQKPELSGLRAIILPTALGSIGDYIPKMAFDSSAVTIGDLPAGDSIAEEETSDKDKKEKDSKDEDKSGNKYVQTIVLGTGYPGAQDITADPVDDDAKYKLFVSSDAQAEKALTEAVTKGIGPVVTGQLSTVTLQMVESATNVPITNFGREQVLVTLPVTDTLYDQQICAVSLKEDGSLDIHYGTKSQEDGKNFFTFATNHFSPYGIYAGIGDTAQKIAAATAELHNKDVTPDTGDHFPLKWIIAIFIAALGGILLLNVPGLVSGRRKRKKSGS